MPLPPPSTPVPTSAQEGAALPSATGAAAGSRGPEARIREAPLARFLDIRSQSKGPLHREPGPEEGGRPYLTEVRDLPLHVLIWSSLGLHFGLRDTERFLQALRFPERLGGDNQSFNCGSGNFQLHDSVNGGRHRWQAMEQPTLRTPELSLPSGASVCSLMPQKGAPSSHTWPAELRFRG